MPDRPQSSPTRPFDCDDALRQSFAYQLRPEEAELARSACRSLMTLARESGFILPNRAEPLTRQELRAAAVDLRYLEAFLADIGGDEERTASRQEARAADLAGRLARDVGGIAASLEAVAANWRD